MGVGQIYYPNVSLLRRSTSALTQIVLSAPTPANVPRAFSCPHLFHPTLELTATLTYTSITIYLANLQTVK